MIQASMFDQLTAKFADAATLPQLPTAAIKLNQLLQSDNVNPMELEQAIVSDPALTAALLRAASSAMYGRIEQPVTTVRTALMRLGFKSVKAVSLSLWTQAIVSQAHGRSKLNPQRFTDHSTFVGYMSRYIFSRRMHQERFPTAWSADEIMAAGVLHCLGPALFAVVEPLQFERVLNQALCRKCSFASKFEEMMGGPVNKLGVAAVTAWGLDPLFADVIGHLDQPEGHPTEAIAVSCVHYANRVATSNLFALFNLPADPVSEFAQNEVGLPEEEVPAVVKMVAGSMRDAQAGNKRAA